MRLFQQKLIPIGFAACSFLFQACEPKASSTEQTTETGEVTAGAVKPVYKSPEAFQAQVGEVWQAYLSMKDALVASDATQTSEKAGLMLTALQNTDRASLSPEVREAWSSRADSLSTPIEAVRISQDIEQQRLAFEKVSQGMYALVKNWGTHGETVYKQFCPMALDNKGAFWLSDKKLIRNPYYGDAMLKCGEVQEELSFNP